MTPALSKKFFDIQANYIVWIHSETGTWYDNNIQLKKIILIYILFLVFCMLEKSYARSSMIANLNLIDKAIFSVLSYF